MVYVDDIVIKKSDSRGINDLESFLLYILTLLSLKFIPVFDLYYRYKTKLPMFMTN